MKVNIRNEYYRDNWTHGEELEAEMPTLPQKGDCIEVDDPQILSNPNDKTKCTYFRVTNVTHYFDAEGKYDFTIVYVKGINEW